MILHTVLCAKLLLSDYSDYAIPICLLDIEYLLKFWGKCAFLTHDNCL